MTDKTPKSPGVSPRKSAARKKRTSPDFYEPALSGAERQDLEAARQVEGLGEEVALLRLSLRKILASEPDRLDLCLKLVGALERAIRTNARLGSHQGKSLKEAMARTIAEIILPIGGAAVKAFKEWKLRPYQFAIMRAVAESVLGGRGLTFTVEMARQGGKNETSAHLEEALLAIHRYFDRPGAGVKCSPTFKPQTLISIGRLRRNLEGRGYDVSHYAVEAGYVLRFGPARWVFLSAEPGASVVGHTADILLEVDEAQDVAEEKYLKDFRPMGAAANATTIMWGTTWDDRSLLERTKQRNLELERLDGVKRHFSYDWQAIAACNPAYGAFVEAERNRLGEDHPLFRTQYALKALSGGGRFFTPQHRAQMAGDHPRQHVRAGSHACVAGIDIAGEAETGEGQALTRPGRDSTVVTIAALEPASSGRQPVIRVIEQYAWTGVKHPALLDRLVDILRNVWRCSKVVVDATGIGEPVASYLVDTLGSRVIPFKFTQASKSQLGFDLLAAVNAGRLKLYQPDGSPEAVEMAAEVTLARSAYRANQTLNFYVDPADGHDDFLMSLALAVHAAGEYSPRNAVGKGS